MGKVTTTRWDIQDYLKTPEDRAGLLEAVLEDGTPQDIANVLGEIAKSMGMTKIAEEAGLGRESLYKALSLTGNPELGTVLKVVRALGIRLQAVPIEEDQSSSTDSDSGMAQGQQAEPAPVVRKRNRRGPTKVMKRA